MLYWIIVIFFCVLLALAGLYFLSRRYENFPLFKPMHRWAKYDGILRNANMLYWQKGNLEKAIEGYQKIIDEGPRVYQIAARENMQAIISDALNIPDLENHQPRIFMQMFLPDDYLEDHVINAIFPTAADAHQRYIANAREGDNQNVHDTSVQNHLATTIANMKQILGPRQEHVRISTINNAIAHSDVPPEIKKRALDALQYINNNNERMARFGMDERDGLSLIYNYITKTKHGKDQQNAMNALVYSLADIYENGDPVCATGRFTRIFGSLDGLDNKVSLKPDWAVKQEMLNKASVYRRQFAEELAEKKGQSVDAIENDDNFGSEFTKYLINKYKEEYKGLISDNAIEAEIQSWAL